MASVSPNNHHSTASKLGSAGITLKRTTLEQPLNFNEQWERFAGLCGSTVTAATAWNMLHSTISRGYSGEEDFDKSLYNDVIELLGECVEIVRRGRLHVLINSKTTTIGIARQVHRNANLGFPPQYGLTTDSVYDHAVVFVDDGSIVDATSLVELKTDEKNCDAFPVDDNEVKGQTCLQNMVL
jgi:hypothetical protein